MKKSFLIITFFASVCCFAQKAKTQKQEADYVNPLIGSAATGFAKALDGGA